MKDLEKGFIALFRQFTEWEWYDDANTMRLFIHCLLLANYKDKKWRGKLIKRGSFITSQPKLAHSLKLSIMQIRNSLRKLKSTGEITVLTTAEYSIITVKNYNLYQDDNRLKNRQTTSEEQTSNRQATTTNKDNNIYSNNINTHTKEKNNVCVLPKISKEEREILKNYARKSKATNITAYVHTLIANGGYLEILEQEKAKAEKKKQKEISAAAEKIEEVQEDAETKKAAYEEFKKAAEKIRKGKTNG